MDHVTLAFGIDIWGLVHIKSFTDCHTRNKHFRPFNLFSVCAFESYFNHFYKRIHTNGY